MTTKLLFSTITEAELTHFVTLQEGEMDDYEWTQVDSLPLNDIEHQSLQGLMAGLRKMPTLLMNEATVWSKAIYPLLSLAAQKSIQTWMQVPLYAQYAKFELEGIADSVLGKVVAGRVKYPYLVIVETKRGVESKNPVFQLYAQLLAAARLNWEHDHLSPQEIFGCYTIADIWTLVRGQVEDIDTDVPTLRVEYSREYMEKTEADTIFKILKNIVSKHIK
jgi:hypothetical protein